MTGDEAFTLFQKKREIRYRLVREKFSQQLFERQKHSRKKMFSL